MNLEELYDNLDVELRNMSIRLTKNVFHSEASNQLDVFIKDFKELIHQSQFNLDIERVTSLSSYTELLEQTAVGGKDYVSTSIEKFYVEFIESIKEELY
ncbi:TPA: hypothetical protein U1B46_000851 [Streptococcus suis]|nr:hypothetical protein [Streptococcus suis]HEM4819148.1 hypothetical protein [Streptococcus suis]